MQVDHTLILRLEHLAKLELSESERKGLMKDLNEILAMVEKLQELDTRKVEPLIYVNEAETNVWREDLVAGQVSRKEALANAPRHDDEFFRVPKVIDL